MSYLITAWTQRPEDEHRLLSSLLSCFLRYEALPDDVLTGPLTDLALPIPITIALPPPEDRAFADVWSALGGELKPSIDLVVITPLDTGQQFHTGRPVERPPRISLGGSLGWPSRETKSRNGVEVWPAGVDGPTPVTAADGPGRRRDPGRRARPRPTAPRAAVQRPVVTRHAAARPGHDRAPVGPPVSRTREPAAAWETATGWAKAMAPLGSEAVEPVPGRTAGRPVPAGGPASAGGATTGAQAASGAPARGAGGAVPDPAATAKGRPGPRVAITRTRQTKKRP